MVGKDGIKVDPEKIDTVTRWARPNDVSQLLSILGLNNYFCRFIQGYSTLIILVIHLRKQNVKYICIDQRQEFFAGIKYALIYASILNLSIFGEGFEVICEVVFLQKVGQFCLKAASLHMSKEIISHVNNK